MYNVKGPSKIVAKTTRRGISQNIDNMREYSKNKSIESEENDPTNDPKPIFHKKTHSHQQRQEVISPQHEEIIKFVHESWNSVSSETEQGSTDSDDSLPSKSEDCVIYYEEEPSAMLEGFKPFDLESWWGKRLYAYLTGSATNGKN